MTKEKIDIIIPWVDGNDPDWQKERDRASKQYRINERANSNVRYERIINVDNEWLYN